MQKHFHNSTIFDKFQHETKQPRENKKLFSSYIFFCISLVVVRSLVLLLFFFSFSLKPKKSSIKLCCIQLFFSFFHKVQLKTKKCEKRKEGTFGFVCMTHATCDVRHATFEEEKKTFRVHVKAWRMFIKNYERKTLCNIWDVLLTSFEYKLIFLSVINIWYQYLRNHRIFFYKQLNYSLISNSPEQSDIPYPSLWMLNFNVRWTTKNFLSDRNTISGIG